MFYEKPFLFMKEGRILKLAAHYIRLRMHYSEMKEAEKISVTVDELAEILDCTHRNVLLILNRMCGENWLTWKPRRGRGHRSGLTFSMPTEKLIVDVAKNLVKKKDLRGALEQMNVSSMPSLMKEDFNDWLYSYFGYKSEVKDHKKVDTLRFPLSGPLTTLDPVHTNFASESHLVRQVFDSLVQYNALTQTVQPHLSHYWEVDAARVTWKFYLRKGVLFHHGREMTASDVFYSLDRARQLAERSLYRWVYDQMKRIEVIDPTTLLIELSEPNELFLPFLSTNRASIIPEDVYEESRERFAKNPVGTGPFKLIRNDRSMCELEAFPHYFQGRAHLDRVEIWNIPDLYEQKRPNGLEHFQITQNVKLPDEGSSAESQVKPSGTTCKFLTFNSLKPDGILNRLQFRKALCEAVNSREIIKLIGAEEYEESGGFYSPADRSGGSINSRKMKNLLDELQYHGEPVRLYTIPHYEADAERVRQLCKLAGINVEIRLLPPADFKGTERLQADIILFAVVLDNDAELRLIDLYKSIQLHLEPEICRRLETRIHTIVQEPSHSARVLGFQELELFLKQQNLIHFLYQKQQKTIYHPSVKGISLDSLGWVQFRDIWFHEVDQSS
jgi:SgrR family transcriptional regulator